MIIRKNSMTIFSSILLIIISSLNVLISAVSSYEPAKQIITVLMGAAVVIAVSFLKEEHLHKAATVIYICAVILMIGQLIFGKELSFQHRRYLYLCGLAIYTAAILPLISFQVAKSITKYNCISISNFAMVCGLVLIPIALIYFQANLTPVIIAMFVVAVSIIVLKREGRLNMPWRFFAIPVILLSVFVVAIYSESSYVAERVNTIICRGANDPMGSGWVRTVLDGIFTSTPLIGQTTYTIEGQTVVGTLTKWADHNIIIALAQYGWLAFIGVLIIYIAFFICLFKMVSKTRQSSFARYTSMFLTLSLVSQAVYSLLGVFLLDGASLNLPFMSGHTVNMMSYLSFGIILMLYVKRDQPSKIQELEVNETPDRLSIIKKMVSYISSGEEVTDEEI